MENYHLDQTLLLLNGASKEQIATFNQWAAIALDMFHENSVTDYTFIVDDKPLQGKLEWNSDFSKDAMREKKRIAEEGGVSLAFFVMSVLLKYNYVFQSEIGEGVDYGFLKNKPTANNFMKDCHFVEVSALLEESLTNTLNSRVKIKHEQISRGKQRSASSSVIITLFQKPITVKEIHL